MRPPGITTPPLQHSTSLVPQQSATVSATATLCALAVILVACTTLQVAILDPDEQRFLEASIAYSNGKPIMSDEDYDSLKSELRIRGSIVSAQVGRQAARWGSMERAPQGYRAQLLSRLLCVRACSEMPKVVLQAVIAAGTAK